MARATKDTDNGNYPANLTIITNGYRARMRDDGTKKIAKLRANAAFKDQEALQAAWTKAVGDVPESDFVIGAGPDGIYSERFVQQMNPLVNTDNVYCPSTGLGMVCLGANYPQYDLGEGDADIRKLLPDLSVNAKDWWKFVCDLSGQSMTSVVLKALKQGHRVVFAIPGMQYFQYKDDLNALVTALTAKGDEKLIAARDSIRFVGPALEAIIPPKLLPCVMPYDKEGLDRLVPGVATHGMRRIAMLLESVSPTPRDGRTNPLDDYDAMMAAFSDKKREPLVYDVPTQKSAGESLSDEDAGKLVAKYKKEVGTHAQRIVRIMRDEGYSITASRVEAILEGAEGKPKKKAAKKAKVVETEDA